MAQNSIRPLLWKFTAWLLVVAGVGFFLLYVLHELTGFSVSATATTLAYYAFASFGAVMIAWGLLLLRVAADPSASKCDGYAHCDRVSAARSNESNPVVQWKRSAGYYSPRAPGSNHHWGSSIVWIPGLRVLERIEIQRLRLTGTGRHRRLKRVPHSAITGSR